MAVDMDPEIINHLPEDFSGLRACLRCAILKSLQQFVETGCENCEDLLQLMGNKENILACTSPHFKGMIGLIDSNSSWVAGYMRIANQVPGIYAMSVTGRLPEFILREMEINGVQFRSRDLEHPDRSYDEADAGMEDAAAQPRRRKKRNRRANKKKAVRKIVSPDPSSGDDDDIKAEGDEDSPVPDEFEGESQDEPADDDSE